MNSYIDEMVTIKNIYAHMQDERSKKTYINYLSYRITMNDNYLLDIYKNCMNIDEIMTHAVRRGKKNYLWGCTENSIKHINKLWPECWIAVFDNDKSKWGSCCDGLTILPPPPQ